MRRLAGVLVVVVVVSGCHGSSGEISGATASSATGTSSASATASGTSGTSASASSGSSASTGGGSTGSACHGDNEQCADGSCCAGEICGTYEFANAPNCCIDFGGSCGPGATCCAPGECANGICVTPLWPYGGDLDLGCALPIGCVAPSECVNFSGGDTVRSACRVPDGEACASTNDDCTDPYRGDPTTCCASGACDAGVCVCLVDASPCAGSTEACCNGGVCDIFESTPVCCQSEGKSCGAGASCCNPMSCENGVCTAPHWSDGGRLDEPCTAFSGCASDASCTTLDPGANDDRYFCLERSGQPCGSGCANAATHAAPSGVCCESGSCNSAGNCD